MPYRSAIVDRVLFVRWKEPELADADALVRDVKDARARIGSPLFGIAIVPMDTPPPGDETRSRMATNMPEILASADALHFVIEGTGFRQAIVRSAITTILFLSNNRGRVFVHQRVDGALAQIRPQLTWPILDILERAERLQLLTPDVRRFQSNRV